MTAELTRNQQQLKLKGHEPPYFMSYQLKDYDQYAISRALRGDLHGRWLPRPPALGGRAGGLVRVRQLGARGAWTSSSPPRAPATTRARTGPLDDSPVALRTALWLMTDEQYKSALVQFLKKKGEDVYAVEDPKRPPSFSRGEAEHPRAAARGVPVRSGALAAGGAGGCRRASTRTRRCSTRTCASPRTRSMRMFVSTEGSRIITEETLYGLHVSAVARAEDGQLLDDSRNFYSPTEAGLPDDKKLRGGGGQGDRGAAGAAQGARDRSVHGPGDPGARGVRRAVPRGGGAPARGAPAGRRSRGQDVPRAGGQADPAAVPLHPR